jgi:hypothetical protein
MSPSAISKLSMRKLAHSAGIAFAVAVALSISALPCFADPAITSISPIYAEQYQTITIDGSDFGDAAAFLNDTTGFADCSSFPCAGTSTALELNDITGGWGAGYGNDGVGLIVDSWSDTQIVLGGFGGSYIAYGPTTFELLEGDQLEIDVWNSDAGSGYNDNPNDPFVPDPSYPVATYDTTVTPEPSSVVLLLTGLLALTFVVLRKRSGAGLSMRS